MRDNPTDFNGIQYWNQSSMTYEGKPLEGVTKMTYNARRPFDAKKVAKEVSEKTGRPVPEILKEWEQKKVAGGILGTATHEGIVRALNIHAGDKEPQIELFSTKTPQLLHWERWWAEASKTFNVHKTEWIVGDDELGLGGILDTSLIVPDLKKALVTVDWKTGKFSETPYNDELMRPPFEKLPACDLTYFSLQLSAYNLIIERNTEWKVMKSYIAHLTEHGVYVRQAVDYRELILESRGVKV